MRTHIVEMYLFMYIKRVYAMKQQDLLNWPRSGPPRNIGISPEPGGLWSQSEQIWKIEYFLGILSKNGVKILKNQKVIAN